MAESPIDATETHAPDDGLVVRMARIRLALVFVFLLVCLILVFTSIWGKPPSFPFGVFFNVLRILQLAFVAILMVLTLICLIGTISPFPLFSVSRAGIRTYSIFGLFGSELTPWTEVTSITIELRDGPRSLTIYSMPKPGGYRLTRWLICKTKTPGRMRVAVVRGMTNKPFDEIVDHLLERYEHEIDEYGIQVIVSGEE